MLTPCCAEGRADAADHARQVAVAEQRQAVLELEVEAPPPGLEQVRAVAAAERRADDALALLAADERDAHELGEVARAGARRLARDDPALGGDRRRVDLVDVLLGLAGEDAEQHRGRQRAAVAVGEPAEVLDLDAVDRAVLGERRRRAGRALRHSGRNGPSTSRSSAATAGTLTAVVTLPPVSAATTCSAAWKPARSVASAVEAPRCGVTMTFG